MHIESSIVVEHAPDRVWALLNDPYFLTKWDRSVAQIVPTSTDTTTAVGFTFDTISPMKKGMKKPIRMHYRIVEFTPGYEAKIALERSKMFKKAVWVMRVEAAEKGALITSFVDFTLRPVYFFLQPLLFFNKKAVAVDLVFLKKAIDTHYANAETANGQ